MWGMWREPVCVCVPLHMAVDVRVRRGGVGSRACWAVEKGGGWLDGSTSEHRQVSQVGS